MKTSKVISRLIETAIAAQKNAYCPYSRYRVGASVLTESGRIFAGCNVENASYGLSICAERVAVCSAVARSQRALKAICVVATAAKPCGACRQVMIEFSTKDTALYLVDLNPSTGRKTVTKTTVFRMLPAAFDPIASGLLPSNPQNLLRAKQSLGRRPRRGRRTAALHRRRAHSRRPLRERRTAALQGRRGHARRPFRERRTAALQGRRAHARRKAVRVRRRTR